MTSLSKKLNHSYQLILSINALIAMRAMFFRSPLECEIISDLLPTDTQKRTAYLLNLYRYSRLKLKLKEGMSLKICDLETGAEIATVRLGIVSFPEQ